MSEQRDTIIEAEVNGTTGSEGRAGLVLATEILPSSLPIIPLRPRPAFPNMLVPMAVSEPSQIEAVKRAMESPSRTLGLLLVRNPEEPDGPDNLYGVGVAGKIVKLIHSDDEGAQFLVNTLERFTVEELAEAGGGYFARVRYHHGTELSVNPELKAYSMAVLTALKELIQIVPGASSGSYR